MNVVLDIETTGLKPGFNEIIQIAVVPLDREFHVKGEPFVRYMRPEYWDRIDDEALKINGITREQLRFMDTKEIVWEYFMKWCGQMCSGDEQLHPLGHNIKFDVSFIEKEPIGRFFHYHSRCSMNAAQFLKDTGKLDVGQSISLRELYNHFIGTDLPRNHDALDDALACLTVYKHLMELVK